MNFLTFLVSSVKTKVIGSEGSVITSVVDSSHQKWLNPKMIENVEIHEKVENAFRGFGKLKSTTVFISDPLL